MSDAYLAALEEYDVIPVVQRPAAALRLLVEWAEACVMDMSLDQTGDFAKINAAREILRAALGVSLEDATPPSLLNQLRHYAANGPEDTG